MSTPLLARCPAFQQVLSRFHCPLKAVRLLSLAPGSFIREHSDNALDFEHGEVRLHVPLRTNAGVEFYVCGERISLPEGGCFYVNVNLPHRVNNRGSDERVHLVIDAEVNDWLRKTFAKSGAIAHRKDAISEIDEFRKVAVTNSALQEITNRFDFIPAAIQAAAEAGYQLNEADIDAALRSASPSAPEDLTGWVPVSLDCSVTPPLAEWLHGPGERFTEPFFDDTIRRFRQLPWRRFTACRAPLPVGNGQPDGMIFHLSRCGSTLVSRSFAALANTLVISEAPPFDEILRSGLPDAERIELLRSLAAVFRTRAGAQGHLILKCDAWHTQFLPLLQVAFPETPWIFLYRDPVEVLVSQLRQPGLHMIPPPENPRPPIEHGASVLAGILTAALESDLGSNGIYVNYSELPGAIATRIARHFRMTLSGKDLETLAQAALLDAKNPYTAFRPDREAKQAEGRELGVRPEVAALTSLYGRLESKRLASAER